jgi:hypothetical protein
MYIYQPSERFLVLLRQTVVAAFFFTEFRAGIMMAISTAIIAITTRSSIKVKPFDLAITKSPFI